MSDLSQPDTPVNPPPIIDLTTYTTLTTPEQVQQYTVWRSTDWLSTYPLHIHTVMDYFKFCPFYDRQCNNELISTQQLSITHLLDMTGIEYQLNPHCTEQRLLIDKVSRLSRNDTELMQSYYVSTQEMDRGTVYCLPRLTDITNYNMQTAMYYITQAATMLSRGAQYSVGDKYYKLAFDDADSNDHNQASSSNVERHEYSNLVNDNIRLLLANNNVNR